MSDLIKKIGLILVEEGQSDYRKFKLGEIIKYSPSEVMDILRKYESELPSAQPKTEKYEYHYDHTDCIWYRPEARNRCPVTCAQYRDGWNDAMNYIFRDGKGYRPYRRDKRYE